MFADILNNVKQQSPLVHNITNYVTVNDCANVVLAIGGSPVMADDILEVEEITSICNSLVINIGTLNSRTVESMLKAGEKANKLNHPVILDPVGAGASKLRSETTFKLIKEIKFAVIRGNISEIKTVYSGSCTTKGVDADVDDAVTENNLDQTIEFAKYLSRKTGSVIAITGAIDIIADSKKAYVVRNGHAMMSKITGTGCMLTSIIGALIGANPDNILEATVTGVAAMGLCGELAYNKCIQEGSGTASFKMHLIDSISKLDSDMLKAGAKIEIR